MTPVVTASATSLDGFDTYTLAVTLTGDATNVYTIYGTTDSPMSVPAGYQEATPFGANTGGTNPAFWAVMAGAEFDSWLTIGVTDGTAVGAISASPGFDIASLWTATTGITQDNAAIFYMDPATMGANAGDAPIVMAQMTVSAATVAAGGTATAQLQGRSTGGAEDWTYAATWAW